MPALAEVPASANLADVVGRRAAEQPRAVMLRRKDGAGVWQDVTAEQFKDEVRALARGLIGAGVAPGDRVALMSHTRYEWTLLDYALWSVGAVVVPIYETSSADQAEWILSNSAARAVIVENEAFEQMVSAARDRLPALEHLWRMQEDLDKLIAASSDVGDETVVSLAKAATAADVATIIYTSGTTGRPKGCELTHENLLSVVRNTFMGPLAGIHAVVESSTMLFLPLAHVFARVIEIGCLEAGIVLGHCEDMGNLLPELASFQPTFVLAVPRVFEKVYNGAESKAVADGKGKIFARAAATAVAYSEALDSAGGARPLRPARLQEAPGRPRRPGRPRDLRRGGARAAARPLLPRGRRRRPRGVRAHRDQRPGVGQPAGPAEDRHRGPAAAGGRGQDRRRRRGARPRQVDLPRLLGQRGGDQGRVHRRRLVLHR